ncbi:TldD/PmbA family protein [Pyrobaculum neutrophilum]|uniref:Peptidase U62 modulator of DNA gyrase n=1 Tax=Pyrobaculum neutrophilum (strain DSM 2338 / JCM 9278 / NBRC 100436 / V24Sta) TaxID=444157 RepID=B1YB26_PYRNV|nr:TldD/PmbA family protein [Pyrobaculum neutrophilum]ACB40726.1 peptidase U62 modulator of DNA gyrase [Pyrobaculum neutrophilum V24Sta]
MTLLKLVRGKVDEAIAVRTVVENYMARFANDEITVFKSWRTESLYLRLAKGRKTALLGFTGPVDLREVDRAVSRMPSLPDDPLYVPAAGAKPPSRAEPPEDFERIPDLVKRAIDAAEGAERSAGVVHLTYVQKWYEDTAGGEGHYAVNRVYMTVRSFLGELAATSAAAGRRLSEIDADAVGAENSRLLSIAKGLPRTRLEPSVADLLLSPLVLGHLMGEVVQTWANGLDVLAGSSRYGRGDLGREAAAPVLTLVEESHNPSVYGYTPFDFEGLAPRPVEIYRRGTLSGFIHTRGTAAALGMEPTGHALYGWARPAPGHIWVAPGDGPDDLEALFVDLGNGVYIHNNWYTRFQNVKLGQFSTVGRDVALLIKGGRPTASVKYVRLADTLERVVKGVAELSKTARQIYWWDMPTPANAPYAVVRSIAVTT